MPIDYGMPWDEGDDGVYDAGVDLTNALSRLKPEQTETPAHKNALNPGDVIRFNYGYWQKKERYGDKGIPPGRWSYTRRLGLVVSSNRAPAGTFLSGKSNLLLNIFEIGELSGHTMDILLKIAYKPNVCNYYRVPTILFHLLGSNQFRTFKLAVGITNVFKMFQKSQEEMQTGQESKLHTYDDFLKSMSEWKPPVEKKSITYSEYLDSMTKWTPKSKNSRRRKKR